MEKLGKPKTDVVWLEKGALCLLDQRLLPHQEKILRLNSVEQAVEAIRDMAVRGAGTIGVTGGFAMALAAQTAPQGKLLQTMKEAAAQVGANSGLQKEVIFGRNEPALHHYHNTYREALGMEPLPLLDA